MSFNAVAFLDAAGIGYTTKGVRVVFPCPWCGDSDLDGDNYGFRTDRVAWGCFRDTSHTGSLTWVIAKLAGWTLSQAEDYLAEGTGSTPVDDLRKRAEALGKQKEKPKSEPVAFLPEFRAIRQGDPFYAYLAGRGFHSPLALALDYGLLCAWTGVFKSRVIMPIYIGPRLVGWTGRAIGEARLRYRAHPPSGEVKDALFGEPTVQGDKPLYVVEGPVDAMKIRTYGKVDAVALMGTAATPAQVERVARLARKATGTIILLDRAAKAEAARLRASLPGVGVVVRTLPNAKDPGALDRESIEAFVGAG